MTKDAYLLNKKVFVEKYDQPPTPIKEMSNSRDNNNSSRISTPSGDFFDSEDIKRERQDRDDCIFDFDDCVDLMDVSPSLNTFLDAEEVLAADKRDGTNYLEQFDTIISRMDDSQKNSTNNTSNFTSNNTKFHEYRVPSSSCMELFSNERLSPELFSTSPPGYVSVSSYPDSYTKAFSFPSTTNNNNNNNSCLARLLQQNTDFTTPVTTKMNHLITISPQSNFTYQSKPDVNFNIKQEIFDSNNEQHSLRKRVKPNPKLEKDDDYSSAESEDDDDPEINFSDSGSLEELIDECKPGKTNKYFWQYNTQSKGPKGKRLCRLIEEIDPHLIKEFEDPVFNTDTNQLKHQGKIRRGDGNDITPNPKKLCAIGVELKRLGKKIVEVAPSSGHSIDNNGNSNGRQRNRKNKNKLASRACRLKKKAQHEANKLKLYGLNNEHKQLMRVLNGIKYEIIQKLKAGADAGANGGNGDSEAMVEKLDALKRLHLREKIAGYSPDFVNSVICKVRKSDENGGLDL